MLVVGATIQYLRRSPVPTDPDTPVHAALAQERAVLLPLPEHDFECDLVIPIRSGKRPYLRFDSNHYTIPPIS